MINFLDESVSLTSDSFFKMKHVKIINNNQKIMLIVQTNVYIYIYMLYRSYTYCNNNTTILYNIYNELSHIFYERLKFNFDEIHENLQIIFCK